MPLVMVMKRFSCLRYVCGVAECNYLTVDDTMLRCHLKALHSDEPYFRCPHCPVPQPGEETQNIGIDKMGIHLRMHGSTLYKCSHCNHHHYHRSVIFTHYISTDEHFSKQLILQAYMNISRYFISLISPVEICVKFIYSSYRFLFISKDQYFTFFSS